MKDMIERSELLAEVAHSAIGQKRKYTNQPYIVHPAEVVKILKDSGVKDKVILSAAWLHDVVEDTKITNGFIKWHICHSVAEVVEQVTDISKLEDGNRKERKRIDREHYLTSDYRGQTVKLADIISNGIDIEKNDKDFSVVYFKEIKLLLPYLIEGNSILYDKAEIMIDDYYEKVENERLQNALKQE